MQKQCTQAFKCSDAAISGCFRDAVFNRLYPYVSVLIAKPNVVFIGDISLKDTEDTLFTVKDKHGVRTTSNSTSLLVSDKHRVRAMSNSTSRSSLTS